jgi:hypothetical protein
MIPEYTGEWMDSDQFDAIAIHDMAQDFKNVTALGPGETFFNIKSAWHRSQPHPQTGTLITFCWENPAAWATLAGDVDKNWFLEQVATRDMEPQVATGVL